MLKKLVSTRSRRQFLQRAIAPLSLSTVVGCAEKSSTEEPTTTRSRTSTEPSTETTTATSSESPTETPTESEIADPTLSDGVTDLWAFDAGNSAEVTVTNDSVLVGTAEGTLFAVDRADGALRWRVVVDDGYAGGIAGSPVVRNGVVFSGTIEGAVTAVELETGQRNWVADRPIQLSDAPIVRDETLYLVGAGGNVEALDTRTGDVRWTEQTRIFTEDTYVNGDPAVTEEHIFLTNETLGSVEARRLDDWELLWERNVGTTTDSVHADSRVFFGSDDGILAVDVARGRTQWTHDAPNTPGSLSEVDKSAICAGFEDGDVRLLNVEDGTRRWESNVRGGVLRDPVLDKDRVYIPSDTGTVYSLHRRDGSRTWKADFSGRTDIDVSDNFIAVGTTNGVVFALGEV